ncbi:hypothetical protein Sarmat_00018 [Rickettsiales endosymbiont of Paramecium tredecaurelia]|uniref:hypothetical protein n=1 Tax=Candidatus Sarmatiella mevalonica TaxID=2770581 RepID=UPI0019243E96|nr:hypothetical protein [Candidatus Sarmatiella mevalonica]MBL3284182.1 hypothetical protein [Candidatus Sarmatiella mevalonica]
MFSISKSFLKHAWIFLSLFSFYMLCYANHCLARGGIDSQQEAQWQGQGIPVEEQQPAKKVRVIQSDNNDKQESDIHGAKNIDENTTDVSEDEE